MTRPHVSRSTHHTVHSVASAETEPEPPEPVSFWQRILRMPLFWALICGALAVPWYLAGDLEFIPFLLTLVGGWLCGFSFVNATLRMPARRGLVVSIAGAVAAALLLWLLIQAVPAMLAPKPNPARALLAVLQMAAVPAAGWVWLGLIGRITASIGARDAAKAPPAPQWEAAARGSIARFRAVPLSRREIVLWWVLTVTVALALVALVLVVTGGRILEVGPKTFLMLYVLLPGLPAYLLISWLLRRRAVGCAVGFEAELLRIEIDGVVERIRYRELDRLVWCAEGDLARIEARGSGVDRTLVAGIARRPGGNAALPVLSRRALRLLEEAGLAAQTRRGSRALTFVRPAGDTVSAPGR